MTEQEAHRHAEALIAAALDTPGGGAPLVDAVTRNIRRHPEGHDCTRCDWYRRTLEPPLPEGPGPRPEPTSLAQAVDEVLVTWRGTTNPALRATLELLRRARIATRRNGR